MIIDATEAGRRMALATIESLQDGTINRPQYDRMVTKGSNVPEHPTGLQTLKEWRLEREITIAFKHTIARFGPKP